MGKSIYSVLIISALIFTGCKKKTIAPLTPTMLTAQVISLSQVSLTWTDQSTNENGFKIQRKTAGSTFMDIGTTNKDVTNYNDAGLTSNTVYTYRVFAFNNAGNSLSYSNEVTVSTYGVPVLSTNPISDTTAITAMSGGNILNDGGQPITARGVVWGTSPNPTITLSTKTLDGIGSGSFTSQISGLSANTTYYLRAYATNSIGTGYGAELSFTTNNINTNLGLIAYYPFNGNANDESGNGNNGTVTNGLFSTDRFGITQKAFNTSQTSNGYVKTNNVIQNVSNTFSICFWVSPEVTDVIRNQGVTGQEGYGLQTVIHPSHGANWGDQSLNAGVGVNVGTNQIQITEHSFLYIASPLVYSGNISGWHHVTVAYNSRTPSLYIDGILVKTGLMSNRQNVRPSSGFDTQYSSSGFGRSFSPNGTTIGQFKGSFDEIRIYNRVLSSSEIKFLSSH